MDILNGLTVAFYSLSELNACLAGNPEYRSHTKIEELQIGHVVASVIRMNSGKVLDVGVPLISDSRGLGSQPRPCLEVVLNDRALIHDSDIDLVLAGGPRREDDFTKVQITRLVHRPDSVVDQRTLFRLLRKKCRVQTDRSIYLVVNVEDNFRLDIDALHRFKRDHDIPYGAIYLLGSNTFCPEGFGIIQAYPTVAVHVPIGS